MSINDRPFGSDRPLLYDVDPWNKLGFAVPNFRNVLNTANLSIWRLADEIGKAQLRICTHIDAQRTQYPSINTVQRIGKVLNRIKSVLSTRQKTSIDPRVEEEHARSDGKPWNLHPVPFFTSDYMQNGWIQEYNRLTMIGLTNIYQHSDNNMALTITEEFASHVWQYFREISILVGTELLGLPQATVVADAFMFDDAAYAGYETIADRTLSFEPLDSPGPVMSTADELDLHPFFVGIPANLALTRLSEYPVGPGDLSKQGMAPPDEAQAPGAGDGSATGEPGGHIGEPQM